MKRDWQVYLLECTDGTYYCGATNNLRKRVEAHQAGKGAKYTRARLPVVLLAWSGPFFTRSEALKLERKVKALRRDKKPEAIRLARFSTW